MRGVTDTLFVPSGTLSRGKQIDSRQKQLESPVKGAKVMTNPNPQMSK